jgi:hypothetical protein
MQLAQLAKGPPAQPSKRTTSRCDMFEYCNCSVKVCVLLFNVTHMHTQFGHRMKCSHCLTQVMRLTEALQAMELRPGDFMAQFEDLPDLLAVLEDFDSSTREKGLRVQLAKRGYCKWGKVMIKAKRPGAKVLDCYALFDVKGLTRHRVASRAPRTNTPAPLVGNNTDVCMDSRPCVLKVESVLQASCDGKVLHVAVGSAEVLSSAMEQDGVGYKQFESCCSHDGLQLAEVPSVMELMSGWAAFKVAVPLSRMICNLIANQDGRVFLPSFKTTGRC